MAIINSAGEDDIAVREVDVLVVGAGISGISAACHRARLCPGKRYAVLERRAPLGGTWDLFRYPGIRSDSDMETLGFRFRPWTGSKSIADGDDILAYLRDTVQEHGVGRSIHSGRHVRRASWSSSSAQWSVDVDGPGGRREVWRASYLWMCAGYYDYDAGHSPDLRGVSASADRSCTRSTGPTGSTAPGSTSS